MNCPAPSGTENASLRQVAKFFGFGVRKMEVIVRKLKVVPYKVGGEERFGEQHIILLAGLPVVPDNAPQEEKDRAQLVAIWLKQAWREFCNLPLVNSTELALMAAQVKSLLGSVRFYERRCCDLEHDVIHAIETRVVVLERRRKAGPSPICRKEFGAVAGAYNVGSLEAGPGHGPTLPAAVPVNVKEEEAA